MNDIYIYIYTHTYTHIHNTYIHTYCIVEVTSHFCQIYLQFSLFLMHSLFVMK